MVEEKATYVKRNVKDSVFCDLFNDPESQLEVYRLLHPEDENIRLTDFKTVTINTAITNQLYNDLGFMVRNKLLILVEAQSSWSINIILRMLMYFAETLNDFTIGAGKNVYSSKKVEIPKPEFYVVYTGTDRKDVHEQYSLAEEFLNGDNSFIDLTVRILRADENSRDIISQYVIFTRILSDQLKKLGRTEEAARSAIRICMNQNILKSYLKTKAQEVISIMTTLFKQEDITKAYGREQKEEGRTEGRTEGITEGSIERAKDVARRMIRAGESDEKIIAYTGLTAKQVQSLRDS